MGFFYREITVEKMTVIVVVIVVVVYREHINYLQV
jgi:hypothetical protein